MLTQAWTPSPGNNATIPALLIDDSLEDLESNSVNYSDSNSEEELKWEEEGSTGQGVADTSDDSDDLEGEGGFETTTSAINRQHSRRQNQRIELPSPPPFRVLEHPVPPHSRVVQLPEDFFKSSCSGRQCDLPTSAAQYSLPADAEDASYSQPESNPVPPINITPASFFQLFFTKEEFAQLAVNTNAYAASKGANTNGHRSWRPTTADEL